MQEHDETDKHTEKKNDLQVADGPNNPTIHHTQSNHDR